MHNQESFSPMTPGVWRRGNGTAIQVRPRGLRTSTSRTTATNLVSTPRRRFSTMSNLLKKRRPTASEAQVGPSSCMASNYHRIHDLTDFPSEEAAAHRWDKDASRHCQGVGRCFSPSQVVFGMHRRTDQTLRSPLPSNRTAVWLTPHPRNTKTSKKSLGTLSHGSPS